MVIRYSFDDAKAKGKRTKQVFEIGSNRAIYQNGWIASSIAFSPWQPLRSGFDIDNTKWELYNIEEDFSQANDLAAQNPEKLRALQDLWWAEASRTNILPLDWRVAERFSDQVTGRPNPSLGRDKFVYKTEISGLPEGVAPDLKNRSFAITAEVEIPEGGAEGMLFTQGGFTGGWGFYIKDQKVVGLHNFLGLNHYRAVSSEPVPKGKVTLAMRFDYKGAKQKPGGGGTITLLANGKEIGRAKVERTIPFKYSNYEGQDIGSDTGSPVELTYQMPFAFTGKLGAVTVELK